MIRRSPLQESNRTKKSLGPSLARIDRAVGGAHYLASHSLTNKLELFINEL